MKRTKNSGFSLVELIIVVAIMAVLTAVLAPTYIKYVEKTRAVKDEEYADNIRRTCEAVVSDPDEKLETGSYLITITPSNSISIYSPDTDEGVTHIDTYLKQVLGNDYADYRIQCKSYSKIEVKFSNTTSPSCSIQYTK